MSDSTDRRVDRSRQALIKALLALIQERDWAAISVQMICDRADVARSTFYAHYQTRQDLLDDVFAAGEAELAARSQAGGLDATMLWLALHLEDAAGFHRRLQGSQAGIAIMARFRKQMRARFADALSVEGQSLQPRDLDFATGGIFAVLESWLLAGCREEAEDLARQLTALLRLCTQARP
jgi:AcrR family transcriptional regulator